MDAPAIDLHAAAERLGVHYQTAYKWVRSGRLPAERVQGRYQLDPAVVDAFGRGREEPQRPPVRRPRRGFASVAEKAAAALMDGDEPRVRGLVVDLVDGGISLTTVIEQVLAPALRHIGAEWHEGRLPIWVEHRASAIVERLLGELGPRRRGRRRGTAMVAALSGDRHSLPTAMAAAALREDNWRVHHLGGDMPGDELVGFCRGHDVDLAVLSVTNPSARRAAERTAAALEEAGVRTLVGRPGATLTELQAQARG